MKKMIYYAAILLLAVSCKTKESTEIATSTSTSTSDYPYTLEKGWKDWQVGDPKHVGTVLKMLKAWETKNLTECVTYFADTVELALDHYRAVLPNDSIASFLQGSYMEYKDVKIKVQDWESVISADKKDEWATVWYRQYWTNAKGVTDSIDLINEAKMKDGKIATFDEYSLHFPEAKK